jgi:hypothetical protein
MPINREIDSLENIVGELENGERHATIWVTRFDAPLYNSNPLATYNKFLLNNVAINKYEKMQVNETFGKPFLFLFGRRVVPIMFTGLLINRQNYATLNKEKIELAEVDWESTFIDFYDDYLDMNKSAKQNLVVWITVQDFVFKGYLVNNTLVYDATNPMATQMSFQFIPIVQPISSKQTTVGTISNEVKTLIGGN